MEDAASSSSIAKFNPVSPLVFNSRVRTLCKILAVHHLTMDPILPRSKIRSPSGRPFSSASQPNHGKVMIFGPCTSRGYLKNIRRLTMVDYKRRTSPPKLVKSVVRGRWKGEDNSPLPSPQTSSLRLVMSSRHHMTHPEETQQLRVPIRTATGSDAPHRFTIISNSFDNIAENASSYQNMDVTQRRKLRNVSMQ